MSSLFSKYDVLEAIHLGRWPDFADARGVTDHE